MAYDIQLRLPEGWQQEMETYLDEGGAEITHLEAHLYNEAGQALTTAGGGKVSGLNDYEMNFIDDQNWVYEATVKADPKERIKLSAKFGTNVQYFYGKEGDWATFNWVNLNELDNIPLHPKEIKDIALVRINHVVNIVK